MAAITVNRAIDLLMDSGLVYARLLPHLADSPAIPYHVRDKNKYGPQRVIQVTSTLGGYTFFTSGGVSLKSEHCELSDTMEFDAAKSVAPQVTYEVYVDNKRVHSFLAPAGQRREEVLKRVIVTSATE